MSEYVDELFGDDNGRFLRYDGALDQDTVLHELGPVFLRMYLGEDSLDDGRTSEALHIWTELVGPAESTLLPFQARLAVLRLRRALVKEMLNLALALPPTPVPNEP